MIVAAADAGSSSIGGKTVCVTKDGNMIRSGDESAGAQALRERDWKSARYESEMQKHGSTDAPVIFDSRATLEKRSDAFLQALMLGSERARIRWYRLHVAAALLARMIDKLDHRNTLARMNQADPSAPSSTLAEDVDGAGALHLQEQDEDRQDAAAFNQLQSDLGTS